MKYPKELKKILSKEVVDILLFGSLVKGGSARDIDVALVVKGRAELDKLKAKVKNILPEADIQIVDVESIYSSLWLTLIKEGFSVKKGKFLFEIYRVKPAVLYKFSLKKLNPVQKVQFNRGIRKVLDKEGTVLTRSVVLVPIQIKNKFMEFLKTWNIYYECQEYELLPVLRKEVFL